nr:MAG TPA: protein of unknown function UPF0697 [Bacteriophage sp.]
MIFLSLILLYYLKNSCRVIMKILLICLVIWYGVKILLNWTYRKVLQL